MNKPCPFCRGTGELMPDTWDVHAAELRRWCAQDGIKIGPDDTVDRKGAAMLLNRSPLTLRNWALADTGPKYRTYAGRYRYPLKALARWIVLEWKGF